MDSPIFEPEDDAVHGLEGDAALPPPMPIQVAPVAPMYQDATRGGLESRKRKASNIDADTSAYFAKIEARYSVLDPYATIAHLPDSEPLPKVPVLMLAFKAAEKTASAIVSDLRQTINTIEDTGAEAQFMIERLDSLIAPKYPQAKIICVYGNCAVGKSSMINAIFAIPNLSLKSGDGSAGTLVPIEYVQASDAQTWPFMARISLNPEAACLRIVERAVQEYWKARLANDEEETKDIAIVDLGKPALQILCSLFRSKDEFADEDAAIQFLGGLKSANDPKILDKLLQWAQDILTELKKLGNTVLVTAYTAEDLNDQLEPFAQDTEYPEIRPIGLECSVWPFVNSIRVFLSHTLLANNITVVDSPGVTDSNILRVDCANRILRKCDYVIVVANLNRAVDDSNLQRQALDVSRRKRHGKLILALTHSDVIDEDECGRLKLTSKEQEYLNSINTFETDVTRELRDLRKRVMSKDAHDLYDELNRKIGLHEYQKSHIAMRRTAILVHVRNTTILKKLQSWYHGATKDPNELPVFCISSKLYMEHVKGYIGSKVPKMSVEMTEIPAVRSHILSLIARSGKLEAFQRHCIGIRLLLSEMQMSCMGSKPMMKRDHLNQILGKLQKSYSHQLKALVKGTFKTFGTPIISRFATGADSWFSSAEKLCLKFSSYPPAGFNAFLGHQGNWRTGKCPRADWNSELMAPLRDQIQPPMDEFHNAGCDHFRVEAVQKVTELIDALEEDMQNGLDVSQNGSFKPFFDTFRDRKQELIHIINEVGDLIQSGMLALNNDAFNAGQSSGVYHGPRSQDGPFTSAMAKIYEKTLQEKAQKRGGLHKVRKSRFCSLVCDRMDSPYPAVKRYVDSALVTIMNKAEDRLVLGCGKILNAIISDFDRVCPENDDHSPLTQQRREVLGQKVLVAQEKMNGELQSQLSECSISLH